MIDMTFETREKLIRKESFEDGAEQEEENCIKKLAAHYLSDGTAKSEEEALELAKKVLA